MRHNLIFGLAGGALFLALAAWGAAAGLAPWAYPGAGAPHGAPAEGPARLSGSNVAMPSSRLGDLFRAVDWWPQSHPVPPLIVVEGRRPDAMACGFCHLPGGQGRPENASLAGLPSAYIAGQVADMRGGLRRQPDATWAPSALMHQVARGAPPTEVLAAAHYFSRLTFVSHVRVVEAATIPPVEPGGFGYRRLPQGANGMLGHRIVETPDDFARFELRDPRLGYVAFVPPGSIERGRRLATTGGAGVTQACAACHGPRLDGDIGPPIAGRSPTYLFRQLLAFKVGDRHGADAAPMTLVAARMRTEDMIDLAAYAASRKP